MAQSYTIHGSEVKIRHPLAPLALGVVTLGVYQMVWWFKINRELRDVSGEGNPVVSLLAMTVGVVALGVPPLVSAFNTATRITKVQDRAGVATPVNPVLALVLLLPIANLFFAAYLQSGLNRAWEGLLPNAAGKPTAPTRAADTSANAAAASPMASDAPSTPPTPPPSDD